MREKILFLLQVPPPVHGASLRNLSLVQSKLLQETFNIRLLPLRFVNEIGEIGKVSPIKFLKLIGFLFNLLRNLVFRRPRFVYFTISPIGNAFYRDVLIVALIKIFGVRIVYHLRGLGIKQASARKFNKSLYDFVFRKSFIICLSQNHTQDIAGIQCEKVFVVPNGIKVEVGQSRDATVPDVPEVLFLTNFIKTKGVFEFLDAITALNEKGRKFKAKMVGAPWDVSVDDLRNESGKRKLGDVLTISAPLFGEEKFDAILNADVFVLPTYNELFPGVILEAMQCGKPVVTTFTGAIPEIIDDGVNGFLVKTRDSAAVAEKIDQLLSDGPLRRRIGDAAREKFMNNYTIEKFEENMRRTFEIVLNS